MTTLFSTLTESLINKMDENSIVMNLRKYPDITRISYTRGGM